jgi:hypothetical protein
VAVFLLTVPPARAGDKEHSAPPPKRQAASLPTPVVHPAPSFAAVSVLVRMPVRRAKETVYVDLRGPDGRVRRFPVEGGRESIHYEQVVLQPGQSLTIRWVAAK